MLAPDISRSHTVSGTHKLSIAWGWGWLCMQVIMAAKNTQQPSLAEGVDKELTCAICLCRYDHPKVLPCLHTYCKGCLEKLASRSTRSRPPQQITCPQCKEVHEVPPQGIDAFRTYFTINNLIDLLRIHEAMTPKESTIVCESGVDENFAVAHCLTCRDHLCESCFELHKRQKLSHDHNVVMLKDLQRAQLDGKAGMKSIHQKIHCEEHKDEALKLFCKTCEKVICRDCALVKHREHEYVFVHEFRHEAQKQLKVLVKKTKKKQMEFQGHSDYLAKAQQSSSTAFLACKQEVNAVCDEMVKSIEARRTVLLKELEALSQTEEKRLNAETDHINLVLARFSNSIQFTEKLLDNEDDVEMMLMSTQAKPALECLQQLTWDQKKAQVKPVRAIFNQSDVAKCKLIGSVCHSLKKTDVIVNGLPIKAEESFSFEVYIAQEVSKLGIDFTPVFSVQVTAANSKAEEPVVIQKKSLNKWRITCTPKESGQYKVVIKVDTVIKEQKILIKPKPSVTGTVELRPYNSGYEADVDW